MAILGCREFFIAGDISHTLKAISYTFREISHTLRDLLHPALLYVTGEGVGQTPADPEGSRAPRLRLAAAAPGMLRVV